MTRVNIDVETRSTVDLRRTSAKVYARHPDTDIILVRYAPEVEGADVREWRCYCEKIPGDLFVFLADPMTTLVAHNAGFEHAILTAPHLVEKYGLPKIRQDRWDDTAARAARQALPRSLDGAAQALGLPVQKDMDGQRVMMQLCKPRSTDPLTWWTPEEHPEKYDRLSEYCATDVQVGTALSNSTKPLSALERDIWLLTEEINERGLLVDWEFAEIATSVAKTYKRYLDAQMAVVTGGAVAGAAKVIDLKNWCAQRGYAVYDEIDDEKIILDKGAVAKLLERDDLDDDVRAALTIRRTAAKNSVAKYEAIVNRVDKTDGRVRDTLIYHGASTGRWAGAGIQPQNFPRRTVKDWDGARRDIVLVHKNKLTFEAFEESHGADVMDVLSRMLRGTIIAPSGHELVFPDFSAIEARGVAWLAGATGLTELFASGGKVYEEFASQIYGVPAARIGKDSTERFLAKTAVLGCGYGMGPKKFVATCELQGKLVELPDAVTTVQAYRMTYPEIPSLWNGIEAAAIGAVQRPGHEYRYRAVSFMAKNHWLMMRLPSGRLLYYSEPRVIQVASPWGPRPALEYSTVNSVTRKWGREKTWGGRLTENAVQAICRDLIAGAMLRLRDAGYRLVGSVHDEVILEAPQPADLEAIRQIMTEVPQWATGFPIAAEVGHGKRYSK